MLLCMMMAAGNVFSMTSLAGAGTACFALVQHVMRQGRKAAYQGFGKHLEMSQRLVEGAVLDDEAKVSLTDLQQQAHRSNLLHKGMFTAGRAGLYASTVTPGVLHIVEGDCLQTPTELSLSAAQVLLESGLNACSAPEAMIMLVAGITGSTLFDRVILHNAQIASLELAQKKFQTKKAEIVDASQARKKELRKK